MMGNYPKQKKQLWKLELKESLLELSTVINVDDEIRRIENETK